MNERSRWARSRLGLCWLFASFVAGCTSDALVVSSAGLSDEATYVWLASVRSAAKTRFSTRDEKVTLSVRLAPNLVGMYQWFRVEWIAPHGGVYLSAPARTRWGSHQELITEMPIRGEAPSRYSGVWRVKLYEGERLLLEREFEITGPAQARISRHGAKRGRNECPPLPQPPGDCIDALPEEQGLFDTARDPEPVRGVMPDTVPVVEEARIGGAGEPPPAAAGAGADQAAEE